MNQLTYTRTLTSCRNFAAHGQLEQWIHTFLPVDGRNPAFSDGLKKDRRFYCEPVDFPLDSLERCCGPEEHMKWRTDLTGFETHVASLMTAYQNGADFPPLFVNFEIPDATPTLTVNDGNHRLEAFRRLGISTYPVIFWMTGDPARTAFLKTFPEYSHIPLVESKFIEP